MFPTRRSVTASLLLVAFLTACSTTPQQEPAKPAEPTRMPPPVGPVYVPPQPTPPPAQPTQPPAPTPLMTPVAFSDLPGWQQDDLRQAWPAFLQSCRGLAGKADWKAVCAAARGIDAADAAAVRTFFETWFVPNLMRAADGADAGLITGYYEAMLYGSRRRGGANQTPLYRVPDDMLTIDLGSVYPQLKGMRLRGRLAGKTVVPYSTRAEIARAPIAGKELLWVNDPVEAFFLEVQGSGRVQLDTGETVRVAYADQNGHPYKAIGRWLVDQGYLTSAEATAQGIRAWIVANPGRRQELFNVNPSYIFFREEKLPDPSLGPKGALGVPLTPGRSVAIDPSFVPLGAPLFLATTEAASDVPMQRLMMAQDTGGAIRGAVRADFFYGFGPDAVDRAGKMKQRGQVWVLMPKPASR
ncbi:murein transglycosylase A [Massilia sp. G4R7]|uniref:peptidoglycan lytic exotransglycosylase n=1 Tax=Massilia phyllostachyos TaxID=2898585 RepID=A0ABS8Q6A5_9BURK|nr:murein transglycosylase A [Massilia phyllostachyos]MCD2517277.1 murein transglycosylase A [Massilia phyllostachyos]